jgi:hypothetical protein
LSAHRRLGWQSPAGTLLRRRPCHDRHGWTDRPTSRRAGLSPYWRIADRGPRLCSPRAWLDLVLSANRVFRCGRSLGGVWNSQAQCNPSQSLPACAIFPWRFCDRPPPFSSWRPLWSRVSEHDASAAPATGTWNSRAHLTALAGQRPETSSGCATRCRRRRLGMVARRRELPRRVEREPVPVPLPPGLILQRMTYDACSCADGKSAARQLSENPGRLLDDTARGS